MYFTETEGEEPVSGDQSMTFKRCFWKLPNSRLRFWEGGGRGKMPTTYSFARRCAFRDKRSAAVSMQNWLAWDLCGGRNKLLFRSYLGNLDSVQCGDWRGIILEAQTMRPQDSNMQRATQDHFENDCLRSTYVSQERWAWSLWCLWKGWLGLHVLLRFAPIGYWNIYLE